MTTSVFRHHLAPVWVSCTVQCSHHTFAVGIVGDLFAAIPLHVVTQPSQHLVV